MQKILEETPIELKWYQNKLDFEADYKLKFENLQKAEIINKYYEPV